MAISLYPHNAKAYYDAIQMMVETKKAAIIHPTGTGKSFIAFKLCEDYPDKTIYTGLVEDVDIVDKKQH